MYQRKTCFDRFYKTSNGLVLLQSPVTSSSNRRSGGIIAKRNHASKPTSKWFATDPPRKSVGIVIVTHTSPTIFHPTNLVSDR